MIDIIIVFWLGFIIANEIYSYKLQKVVANRKSRKYFILIEQRVLRSKKGEEEKGGGGGVFGQYFLKPKYHGPCPIFHQTRRCSCI